MIKKFLFVLLSLVVFSACGGPAKPKVDFGSPTGGPDLEKMRPGYGPNDPIPTPAIDGAIVR